MVILTRKKYNELLSEIATLKKEVKDLQNDLEVGLKDVIEMKQIEQTKSEARTKMMNEWFYGGEKK